MRRRTDLEVAALAREIGIDIAVDLNGITEHCRSKIFALRAAPIQVNYLGYPGTMGAAVHGLSDRRSRRDTAHTPDALRGEDHLSAGQLHTLRFRLCDRRQDFHARGTRASRAGVRVLLLQQHAQDHTHDFRQLDEDLDAEAEASVLWLPQANSTAVGSQRKEAARRGVDPERLIFAERWASLPERLARLRAADLFLDTLPYNAHATALDALWAGLPLLTCEGQGFAGRVAASLLRTIGLPQLITGSISQYEDMATALAADPGRLSGIRQQLAQNRSTTALLEHGAILRKIWRPPISRSMSVTVGSRA